MSLVLLTSCAISVAAFVYSLFFLHRVRDRRLGFVSILLALLATHLILTAYGLFDGAYLFYSTDLTEYSGLAISVMAFVTIHACMRISDDRNRARETLTEREAFYRAIVEDQTELICRFLPDTTVTYVNDIYCRYFCRYKGECVGQMFLPLVLEEDREKLIAHFASLGPENEVGVIKLQVIRSGGEVRWMKWTNRAILDDKGNVIEFQGTGRDITDRIRIAQDLTQSEARTRLLIENAPYCIHEIDLHGRFLSMNAIGLAMMGASCEQDIVGLPYLSAVVDEDADRIGALLQAALEGEASEFEFRAHGGLIFSSSFIPILGDDGTMLRLMGITQDITERKQAEDQLRLTQYSLDHNPNAIFRIDFDGSICYANEAASHSLGYSYEELLGMSVSDIDPDFSEERWLAHWREMRTAGSTTFEAHHKTKGGRVFPVEIQSNVVSFDGKEYIWASVRDLSEKIEAGKDLRASEERFRQAFNCSPIGMAITSLSGAFLDVNDTFCEILGYSVQELLGRDFQSITHPDDCDVSVETMASVLRGEEPRARIEKRYLHKNGHTVWANLSVAVVRDEEGVPQICLAQIEDITDRVLADRRLYVAEAKSRDVLETAADAIVTINRKGLIETFNPAASRMFGYGPEEVLGRNISMLMPEPDRTRHGAYIARYMTTRKKHIIGSKREVMAARKNGRRFHAEVSISEAWAGDDTTFTGIVRDITERKLAEDQLREHAVLVEIAPSAILLLNLDDTVKFCNRATEEIYGWSREEILGRCWNELSFTRELSYEYDNLKESTLCDGSWSGELRKIHRSGKELVSDARAVLLRDDDGRPRSLLLVCNDITQRKALELQRLHGQRLESLGTMAAGISHDLNNILTPILMAIAPLRNALHEEHTLEILDTVLNCAERGSKIVKQVLAFAKESKGARVPLYPQEALLETKSILSDTFPKSIRLHWEIDEDVSCVFADPTHLQQVLLNVCINARDAMPEGGDLLVRVENVAIAEKTAVGHLDAEPGAYVAFHVKDSGIGMPPHELGRIFDPFYTTKDQGEGTGLGLATVSTIVKSLGGFIDVQTEIGKGTHFKIYLPAHDAPERHTLDDVKAPVRPGTGQVVLVVDDESGIATMTRRILESGGYQVLTAGDGVEGKSVFEKHRSEIDLLLTDMMMPGMDGAELIRAARALDAEIKVIAVSGLDDRLSARWKMDVNESVLKPFDSDTLLGAVGRVLNKA